MVFVLVGMLLLWHSFAATNPAADIDKDGVVNITDLSLLLSSYGASTSSCITASQDVCDLNSDNMVNVFDLSILLSNYGGTISSTPSYIGSIDTMKLSADHDDLGLQPNYQQALNIVTSTNANYITDDSHLEYPSTLVAWANAIHAAGKHVWYRVGSVNLNTLAHGDSSYANNFQGPYDGYPSYGPGYLTNWHNIMVANPGIFQPGDIIDANAEPEDSTWWHDQYGCDIQSSCTNCPVLGTMTQGNVPCRPWSEFNASMQKLVTQQKADLTNAGITPCTGLPNANCVFVGAHSVDYGTADTGPLNATTVTQAGGIVTLDGYIDDTNPTTNASTWTNTLNNAYNYWKAQVPGVKFLMGEWGYNNGQDVSDQNQVDVITADTQAFKNLPYVIGMNYWVGPGGAGWGGYTYLMRRDQNLVWTARPALTTLSNFYQSMGL